MNKVKHLDKQKAKSLFINENARLVLKPFPSYFDLAVHHMARASWLDRELEEAREIAASRKEDRAIKGVSNILNSAAKALKYDAFLDSPIAAKRIGQDRQSFLYGIRIDEPGSSVKKMTHFLSSNLDENNELDYPALAIVNQIFMMASQSYRAEAMAQMQNLPYDPEYYMEEEKLNPDCMADWITAYKYHVSRMFFNGFAEKKHNKYTKLTNYDVEQFMVHTVSQSVKTKSVDDIDNISVHLITARRRLIEPIETYLPIILPELLSIKVNNLFNPAGYPGANEKMMKLINLANSINVNSKYILAVKGDSILYKDFRSGKFQDVASDFTQGDYKACYFDFDLLKNSVLEQPMIEYIVKDFIDFLNDLFNNKHNFIGLVESSNILEFEKVQNDPSSYHSSIRSNGKMITSMNRATSFEVELPSFNPYLLKELGLYFVLPHTFVSDTNTRQKILNDLIQPVKVLSDWAYQQFCELLCDHNVIFNSYKWNYVNLDKHFKIIRNDEVDSVIAILKDASPNGVKDIRDGLSNINIIMDGVVKEVQAIDVLDPEGRFNPDINIVNYTDKEISTNIIMPTTVKSPTDQSVVVRSVPQDELIDVKKRLSTLLTMDQFISILIVNTPIRVRCQEWLINNIEMNSVGTNTTNRAEKRKLRRINLHDLAFLQNMIGKSKNELIGDEELFYDSLYDVLEFRDLLQIVFSQPRTVCRVSSLQSTLHKSSAEAGFHLMKLLDKIEEELSKHASYDLDGSIHMTASSSSQYLEIEIQNSKGKMMVRSYEVPEMLKNIRLARRRAKTNFYRSLSDILGIDSNFISQCVFDAIDITAEYNLTTYSLMDLLDKIELADTATASRITSTLHQIKELDKFSTLYVAMNAIAALVTHLFGYSIPDSMQLDAKDLQNIVSGNVLYM